MEKELRESIPLTEDMWEHLPFKRNEFSCKCGCGFKAVDAELLRILIDLREKFGPIVITGPNRCVEHNIQQGGAKKSYHTKGMAADIKGTQTELSVIWEYLLKTYPDRYGFILYKSWIHVDVRDGKYREIK